MTTRPIQIRLSENQLHLLEALVRKGVFRNRTRAIETFINEGLEKRNLINYKEVLSD
jgi:Arc/MetJ-type ribon-helix-helix transcriptional regulator